MNAAMPPAFCALATACSATVVFPDDSGPYISTMRPRGRPPRPSATSSAIEPVGITSTGTRVSSPRRMTEPLPNCRSIWSSAVSRDFSLSPARSTPVLLFAAMGTPCRVRGLRGPPAPPRSSECRPAGHPPAVIDGHRTRRHRHFRPAPHSAWPGGSSRPFSLASGTSDHRHQTTIERTCIRSWTTRRKRPGNPGNKGPYGRGTWRGTWTGGRDLARAPMVSGSNISSS